MSDTLGHYSGRDDGTGIQDTFTSTNTHIRTTSPSLTTMENKIITLKQHKKKTLYSCPLVTKKKQRKRKRTRKREMRQQSSIRDFLTTEQQTQINTTIQGHQTDTNTQHDQKQEKHLKTKEIHQRAAQVQTTLDSRFGDKLDLEQNNDIFRVYSQNVNGLSLYSK